MIVPSSPTVAPPPRASANPLAALCNWLPVTASLEPAAILPSFKLDNVVGPPLPSGFTTLAFRLSPSTALAAPTLLPSSPTSLAK